MVDNSNEICETIDSVVVTFDPFPKRISIKHTILSSIIIIASEVMGDKLFHQISKYMLHPMGGLHF